MKMKLFMAASLAALMTTANVNAETSAKPNGMWTAMAGTASLEMDSGAGASLGVKADLYEAGAIYRFNDGLMVGGKMQKGYSNHTFPDEQRVEALVGYSTRVKNAMPYVLAGYGWREVNTNNFGVAEKGNFHWVKAGAKVFVDPKVFVSGAYRFRDSNDYNMRDNTLYYGAGVSLTKDTSVEIEVGKSKGQDSATSDSTVTSLIFSKRFF